MPEVVQSCVLANRDDDMPHQTSFDRVCCLKGDDGMSRPTLFDRVCCPKAVMFFHAQRRSTVCAAQRR